MGRHAAADFGLFADDHGLQDAGVVEVEGARDVRVLLADGDLGEWRGEGMEVVADFVDGELFGFG